ncbi:MAG TPA: HAMP domain-containing sensor histidine kinase, partial [Longimicrobiaceae bacterium]|nr:HAMP domain-containing sensor histidine kinase [Longimicrobiaceae bacterium]
MPHALFARLRDLLASRSNRPLVLLLAALAAVGVAVFDAQRAVRSNRARAEELLHGYASFAAWSYARTAAAALDSTVWGVLGPVMHEFPHQGDIPHPATLVHYRPYDEREGEHLPWLYPPSILFGYALGSDTLSAARNAPGDPHKGWRVDSLPGVAPGERALMRDSVLAHLRARWRPGWRYGLFEAGAGGERRVVGYTLMPTEWGDTILYGFVLDREDYARLLRERYERAPLLPAAVTHDAPTAAVLSVRVAGAGGEPIWTSDAAADWRFHGDDALPPELGGLRVRAAVRPERAGQLVIGGLPRSRLPFLAVLAVLAGALAVVAAGQLRREGELARLRADFVASVSHELRTPLAQVRLFVETLVLGRTRTEAQRRWALENIDRETARLAHLVENVLLVSRAARDDDAPLPLAPADLAAEVRQAVDAFAPLAAARRVSLRTELPEGVVAARLHGESFR